MPKNTLHESCISLTGDFGLPETYIYTLLLTALFEDWIVLSWSLV